MSEFSTKLSLFTFLVLGVFSSYSVATAQTQGSDGPRRSQFEYSGDDAVSVYVNNDVYTMPPVGYFNYYGIPITPGDVTSARIEGALPGYGCFFVSLNPDSFASQTFFSSSTSGYNSNLFDPLTFETPFSDAVQLYCFRVPNPRTANPVTWVMLQLDNENGDKVFALRPIAHDQRLAGYNSGYKSFTTTATLAKATVVHPGGENTICLVRSSLFKLTRFSSDSPLTEPIKNFKGITCTSR